ncbi:MAG: DUF397 domain-containing protein [Pseudonocardiaceae bacterium]
MRMRTLSRPDFRHAVWHKNSRSHGNGDRVEITFTGTVVAIGSTGWLDLLTDIQRGEIGPM